MAQQPPSLRMALQDHMSPPHTQVSSPPLSTLRTNSIISPGTAATSGSSFQSLTPTIASSYYPLSEGSQSLFSPDAPIESDNLANGSPNDEVDPQILEALKSKDRLYVLKLGELMEGLLDDQIPRVEFSPATSYQRLLVRRCCTYYKLTPETDPVTKAISVLVAVDSRIPPVKIRDLVPAEASIQPTFKIMRRDQPGRRSKAHSQAGSVAGEDADLSDVEPSESGSLGGQSNATGGSSKIRMTIEQREAAYNEARSRIFMDFEDKDKDKDTNSSTLSVSGSAASSNGGGSSSTEDIDDSASTAATESEWSGPISRDKNEARRGGSLGSSATSSSRSLRSSAPPFHGNGSGSSRNSRAPSPSFAYPTLYEPNNPSGSYDQPQMVAQMMPYPQHHYVYPYPPPNQPPYIAYPYYPPYPPQQNPVPHQNQPGSQGSETYTPPLINYGGPYGWAPPPSAPPVNIQHPHHQMPPPPRQMSNPTFPNTHSPPYPQHFVPVPGPYAQYPASGYYPPQPGHTMAPQPPLPMTGPSLSQPIVFSDPTRVMPLNGFSPARNHSTGNLPMENMSSPTRPPLRNTVHHSPNGTNRRAGAPQPRPSWSYGPGIGMTAYPNGPNSGGDVVGPRMSSRKTSSGSSGNRTGDEVDSNASSSTTSSSRRTYTSTSSAHPLPARPDWAVGLKPQPAHNRHHDYSLAGSRTMSPRIGGVQLQGMSPHQSGAQQLPPVALHSTDFPPLSSAPEKRVPTVGAWNNSSTRSILISNGNGNNNGSPSRLEEPDRGFERPPKGSGELFNPKLIRRPHGSIGKEPHPSLERAEQEKISSALVDSVAAMSMEEMGVGGSIGAPSGGMIVPKESVVLSS